MTTIPSLNVQSTLEVSLPCEHVPSPCVQTTCLSGTAANVIPPNLLTPLPLHSLTEVSTTAQAGSSVLTVRATDRDSGNFGLVSGAGQSVCSSLCVTEEL